MSEEAAGGSPAGGQERDESTDDESLKPTAGGPPAGGQVRRDSNGQKQPEPAVKAAGAESAGEDDDGRRQQGQAAGQVRACGQKRPESAPEARPKQIDQIQPKPQTINVFIEIPCKFFHVCSASEPVNAII